MAINPVSLAGAGALPMDAASTARSAGSGSAPFAGLVDRFLGNAVQSGDQANNAVRDMATGRTDSLHEVMLQVAEADLSFRLILEMRNRLTDAYQEIMKMQV
jgi:flagellar hook-basal body complex protein FliE